MRLHGLGPNFERLGLPKLRTASRAGTHRGLRTGVYQSDRKQTAGVWFVTDHNQTFEFWDGS